ncbi:MAG: ATP-binding protein [Bacteroidales bacterium]|jgi:predicted AAA+ superfamily ATPase|nr:ATP-binding protein [Bacteroidales bacterium]
MIHRILDDKIKSLLGGKKAIMIMGARQVGKSTLLHQIFGNRNDVLWLNGDDPDVQSMFVSMTSTRIKTIIGSNKVVIIDEAQRIADIGLRMKLITDQVPDVQLVATGSSSFELASRLNESLAGRKREFKMFPLSFAEMVNHTNFLEEKRLLPHRLVYGYYPEIVNSPGNERIALRELTDSYLYKDIFVYNGIHKSEKLVKLVKALAFQIGSQVSYNEIGQLIGLDSKTVERYVDVLEQTYIVFKLDSFARNLRNELKASRKIYFWDLGIRNAIIGNLASIENRNDAGALWENFVISERMKRNSYTDSFAQCYFWRTQQQQEIDFLEEQDGQLHCYEFKWNTKKANAKFPVTFANAYPGAEFKVITPDNVEEMILE